MSATRCMAEKKARYLGAHYRDHTSMNSAPAPRMRTRTIVKPGLCLGAGHFGVFWSYTLEVPLCLFKGVAAAYPTSVSVKERPMR